MKRDPNYPLGGTPLLPSLQPEQFYFCLLYTVEFSDTKLFEGRFLGSDSLFLDDCSYKFPWLIVIKLHVASFSMTKLYNFKINESSKAATREPAAPFKKGQW